jgi:hypothetical protein
MKAGLFVLNSVRSVYSKRKPGHQMRTLWKTGDDRRITVSEVTFTSLECGLGCSGLFSSKILLFVFNNLPLLPVGPYATLFFAGTIVGSFLVLHWKV